jgi:hypothetical protein
MSFEDFFDDPSGDVEKCFELSEEQKQDLQCHLKELSQIEAMWN